MIMDTNQAHKLLFIRSLFLLCIAAINEVLSQQVTSKYCCSAGECTALNITKFHLYDKNQQALEDWTQLTYDQPPDDKCPSGSAINTTSPAMSELVVMARSRCRGNEPKYYVGVLGDHKGNSNYRIDIAPGGPNNIGYYRSRDYRYCINTPTTVDRRSLRGDHQRESFTVLVTTKITTTEHEIRDSDADVFARVHVLVPREGYGVIYTTYNTTNGTDYCSQKYIPLLANDIGSEISNGTQITVWWKEQNHSNGYIVVMGDDCTTHGPCSIVKNTTKVTVKFNGLSSILDEMKIRIYNIITTNCTNPEIGDELVHLFKGCSERCCENSGYYHNPTITPPPDPSTSTATVTHATTDCDKTEDTSTTQMPHSTVHTITMKSSTSVTTQQIITIVVCLVVSTIPIICCVVLCCISRHKRTEKVSSNNNVETQLKPCDYASPEASHIYDTTTPDDTIPQILLSGELESSSVKAEEVLQDSSACSAATKYSPSKDSWSQKKLPAVLIIYSPNTTEGELKLICTLITELRSYEIEILSHDLTSIQGSTSAWLEREAKKVTVVLCICNKKFKEDWEGQSEASLPLIQSLKHLIHGTVQIGENLSKYAVVLLELSHRQYIPTMYLQSDSRQFTIADTKAIAQYVLNIPSYELSRESSTAAISDSAELHHSLSYT